MPHKAAVFRVYHQQTSHFWDRKRGITTDGTHFLHAFPAKWGPNFGYQFYEAACPEMKLLALLRSSHMAEIIEVVFVL